MEEVISTDLKNFKDNINNLDLAKCFEINKKVLIVLEDAPFRFVI